MLFFLLNGVSEIQKKKNSFPGPSHWGKEYKTCLGKYQSPIDIEEKDVTTMTFPELQFSGVEGSHKAYMTNNGHTGMK